MCNVIIEDCAKYVQNKFELIIIASERAKKLSLKQVEPLVKVYRDKPTITALKEIRNGYVVESFDDEKNKF